MYLRQTSWQGGVALLAFAFGPVVNQVAGLLRELHLRLIRL